MKVEIIEIIEFDPADYMGQTQKSGTVLVDGIKVEFVENTEDQYFYPDTTIEVEKFTDAVLEKMDKDQYKPKCVTINQLSSNG